MFDISVGPVQRCPFLGWAIVVGDADEKDSPLRRWCRADRFKIRFVLAKTSFNIIGEVLAYGGVRVAGPAVRRVRPARREGDAAREKKTEKRTHREWR